MYRTSQSRIKHWRSSSRGEGRGRDPNPSWKIRHFLVALFKWLIAERTSNPGPPAGLLCSFQDTWDPVPENCKHPLLLFLILALVHGNSTTLMNLTEVERPCALISLNKCWGSCWEEEYKRFSLGKRIIQGVPHQACVLPRILIMWNSSNWSQKAFPELSTRAGW